MNRLVLPLVAVFFVLSGQAAWAQVGFGPGQQGGGRPALSPYLQLNRGGAAPGINYLGLVQPQIQNAKDIQQLQGFAQQQTLVDNNPLVNKPIMDTGNNARFQTSFRYFQTVYRSGAGGYGAGPINTPAGFAGGGLRR